MHNYEGTKVNSSSIVYTAGVEQLEEFEYLYKETTKDKLARRYGLSLRLKINKHHE